MMRPAGVTFQRPAQQPFEDRRGTITRVDEMAGGEFVVRGRFFVDGSGEGVFDVPFPVRFTEEPYHFAGSILAPNQALVSGDYPQITSTVKTWVESTADDGTTTYWVGGSILYVALGHTGMKCWITFRIEGKAIRNPVRDPGSVDAGL